MLWMHGCVFMKIFTMIAFKELGRTCVRYVVRNIFFLFLVEMPYQVTILPVFRKLAEKATWNITWWHPLLSFRFSFQLATQIRCHVVYKVLVFVLVEKASEQSPSYFLFAVISSAIIAVGFKLVLMSHVTKYGLYGLSYLCVSFLFRKQDPME